jgi:hypothetical protein
MTMSPKLRELDHRSNDGIDVRLLWSPRDDHVVVTVADARNGERFELDVRDGESPLDVFRHPYAYAASRRIDTRSPVARAA